MQPSVLAIAAHPDDIEFNMSGTLLRLVAEGWQAHYFNIANGCCGSVTLSREDCAKTRLVEAQQSANLIPAKFHPPIRNDLEIFYDSSTLAEISAIVREVQPEIVLTHAMVDYMEDHQNAARLAVGGVFTRGMPNFATDPEKPTFSEDVALYHAQPHGNRSPMRQPVLPSLFVDVSSLMDQKRQLLGVSR